MIQIIQFYYCFQDHKHTSMVALTLFSLCLVDSNAHRIVSAFIMLKKGGKEKQHNNSGDYFLIFHLPCQQAYCQVGETVTHLSDLDNPKLSNSKGKQVLHSQIYMLKSGGIWAWWNLEPENQNIQKRFYFVIFQLDGNLCTVNICAMEVFPGSVKLCLSLLYLLKYRINCSVTVEEMQQFCRIFITFLLLSLNFFSFDTWLYSLQCHSKMATVMV